MNGTHPHQQPQRATVGQADGDADRRFDEWERERTARLSAGYQSLRLITSLARLAGMAAENWLECHDDACRCGACREDELIGYVKRDLNGLAVLLEMSTSMIQGSIPSGFPKLDGRTYGDDLRSLAALSDEIDARDAAEADDAVVVPAEGGGR